MHYINVKILYIETDELLRTSVTRTLEDCQHEVRSARCLQTANAALADSNWQPEAIVMNPYVMGLDGTLLPVTQGDAAYKPGLDWVETLVARDSNWEERIILIPAMAVCVNTDIPLFERMAQNGQVIEMRSGFSRLLEQRLTQIANGMEF